MESTSLGLYVVASLALIATPGQDMLYVITRSLALVWQGILSNVTNPKIILFFLAFLPQFVDPASANPTRDLVFLGVLYAALGLPVKVGVALAAGSLSERVLRRPATLAWVNRVSGGVLVALGLRLAATDR